MLPTINIRLHAALEKFLDPSCIFMRFFDSLKKFSTKLLHIMLLESLLIVPLEASKKWLGIASFVFSLEVDK